MPIYPEYLIFTFAFVALFYSLVGFGGGSSYIALMLLSGVSYKYIPIIALTCNLIVVCSSAFHYIKNKQVQWNFVIPFILSSIPMSLLGGSIKIEQQTFKLILSITLLIASIKMMSFKNKTYNTFRLPSKPISIFLGGFIGFISGLIGIGGGIFLSPILYTLKWAHPKTIASSCSIFILFNSLFGIFGQLSKTSHFINLINILPLLTAVLVGGQIGSYLGSNKLKPRNVERITGILIFIISVRILLIQQ
ncbi:MAG: sulfite exporter TauE/SafE family protein [Bacteriovoracaceae bacterium]|nr:sulfite exporter TauE/SafE family protein [Bacteriovoracaceae bacterium]